MLIHLNNRLLPKDHPDARISPFDRGFLFGDGIYEGLRAFDGKVVGMGRHIARMSAGLREAGIAWDAAALAPLTAQLLEANGLSDAFIYWQVSRGTPNPGDPVRSRRAMSVLTPTVFGFCDATPGLSMYGPPHQPPTKAAVTLPDTRWLRGHIKSISLMGSVLNVGEAHDAGADDAVLVRDGLVAETTSANVLLALPREGGGTEIATPSLGSVSILAGVTRDLLLEEAAREGLQVTDRPVRAAELAGATEVMACGTLTMVTSITRLDGRAVGDGQPGPAARRLLAALVRAIERDAGR